jgi:AcrR family transcriptional regulator
MPAKNAAPPASERKLTHIVRHSAQIFAERGFKGASIREISRATGVSLSGLYYYFESKQKLLYLIQKTAFTTILARLEQHLEGVRDPQRRLKLFIQNHIEYFLSHPAEMKVLSHEDEALEEPYKKEIDAIKKRYYTAARRIFEEVAAGNGEAAANPRVAILALYGMMNWTYKWHNPKVDPGAAELAETMAQIFLRGVLGTRNGESSGTRAAQFEKITIGG